MSNGWLRILSSNDFTGFLGLWRYDESKSDASLCCLHNFWVIWLEMNARIFEDKFDDAASMWDRVCHLALFWTSVSTPFKGISFYYYILFLEIEK